VASTITVSTTGPHTTSMRSNTRPYHVATLLGLGLPLGICLVAMPSWRRKGVLAVMLLLIIVVPACGGGGGGGGGSQQHQDPGTPSGTYTITLTATSGPITQQGAFTLVVQ